MVGPTGKLWRAAQRRQLTLRSSFVPSMGVARRARHAKKFSHRSSSHEGQKAVSSSALSVQRVMVHVRPFPHPPTRVGSGPPTRTSPGAFLAWALSYSPALHLNVCASSCALRLWLRQPRGRRRRNIPVLEVMTASCPAAMIASDLRCAHAGAELSGCGEVMCSSLNSGGRHTSCAASAHSSAGTGLV